MATKFQITLPDELASQLKDAAAAQGVPLAEWIRVTMKAELRRFSAPKSTTYWLDRIRIDDEPAVSSRIDEILYGEPSS